MRTKHLLWALALPSVFAACTQDEFAEQAQGTIDNRPVVGAISLNIAEEPTTRWVYEGGFKFDNSDYIGAALMDTYNSAQASGDWDQKYSIVDYIQTNYKYGYKDGWTNNDAIMSEGNYFFYMPYNDQLKSRAGLPLVVPTEQFAYNPEVETAVADDQYAWRKHQMFIGYDDVKVDDQTATPQMVEVFAKPRFNINYTGSNNVLVERVVVTDATGKFDVVSTLKPTGTVSSYNPIFGGANDDYELTSGDLAQAFRKYNAAVGEYELGEGEKFVSPLAGNEASLTTSTTKSDFLSLNFVPAKSVTGLMVMPAGSHSASDVKIEIYTSKGLATISGLSDFNDLETATPQTGITYSNLDVLATVKAGDGSKAKAININFNDLDIKQPKEVTVATTSQLESIIRWYEDPNGTYAELTDDPKTLTVNVTGDVEFTKTVYDAIKGNPNISFKFVVSSGKNLIIPAELAADALSLLSTASTGNVIVEGTQALNNASNAKVTYTYDIEVVAGATLNVNGGNKGIALADVNNEGAINVDGTVEATEITNYKDLTVNTGATLTAKVLNNATVTTAGAFTTYTQNATLTNNGTLKLNDQSENQSKIVNNNKLYIVAGATNAIEEAVLNTTNGYTGIIENADAQNSYIYSQGTLTNNGDINNTGAMYSQGSGQITNEGYIMANDGATTYVTTNNGDIELEKRTTETTVNVENGSISYTLQSSDLSSGKFTFDASADKFNTLKVGMNVQFSDKGKLPASLILNATSNISVICVEGCKFTSIKAEGNVRYSVQGTKVETTSLTVAAGVVFQIPALSSFGVYGTSTGTIDNKGEILVGGDFWSDLADQTSVSGTWSSAGTGSYHWSDANDNFGGQ